MAAEQDEVGKMLRDAGRQQPAPQLDDHKTGESRAISSSRNLKKANKRQRKEQATLPQDSSLENLPPAKRLKANTKPVTSNEKPTIPAEADTASTGEPPEQQYRSELDPDSLITPELLLKLHDDFQVVDINIISSTKIQARVTQILGIVTRFSWLAPIKPYVVFLHAKGPAASKLITIVEIVKREVEKEAKWFQYNGLDQFIAVKKEKDELKAAKEGKDNFTAANGPGRRLGSSADEMDTSQDVDDKAGSFETMKPAWERALEGKSKVRAVPVLSAFLSRVRVPILKELYGEQTNALT